ncbi:MAG: hypothetical protein AAFO80_04030 [Pseudomonadota bacterium]
MTEAYEYRLSGRRPVVWFGLCVILGLLTLTARHDAPPAIWALWGAVAASLAWMLIANPISTLRLTDTDITWREGGRQGHLPMAQITGIKITDWSDGAPDCRITLITGETVDLPGNCLPDAHTLHAQFTARGLPVNAP